MNLSAIENPKTTCKFLYHTGKMSSIFMNLFWFCTEKIKLIFINIKFIDIKSSTGSTDENIMKQIFIKDHESSICLDLCRLYIYKYQVGSRDREENLMTANENIREISSLQGLLEVVCYALANMMMNLISAWSKDHPTVLLLYTHWAKNNLKSVS